MKRVLVTGSRDWWNEDVIRQALILHEPDIVIQGGARGADSIAYKICKELEIVCVRVPAKWKTGGGGKAEGVFRNGRMLGDWKPHIVLAFHDNLFKGSRGTFDMCSRSTKAEVKTYLHHSNGKSVVLEEVKRS